MSEEIKESCISYKNKEKTNVKKHIHVYAETFPYKCTKKKFMIHHELIEFNREDCNYFEKEEIISAE